MGQVLEETGYLEPDAKVSYGLTAGLAQQVLSFPQDLLTCQSSPEERRPTLGDFADRGEAGSGPIAMVFSSGFFLSLRDRRS